MKLFNCTCKRFFTPCDPHNCRHEVEQELIEQDQREAHEAGECKKGCDYCQLAEELKEESKGG